MPVKESTVPAKLPLAIDSELFSQSIMENLRLMTDLSTKFSSLNFMNPEGGADSK